MPLVEPRLHKLDFLGVDLADPAGFIGMVSKTKLFRQFDSHRAISIPRHSGARRLEASAQPQRRHTEDDVCRLVQCVLPLWRRVCLRGLTLSLDSYVPNSLTAGRQGSRSPSMKASLSASIA